MLELELFWNIALGLINVTQCYVLNSNAQGIGIEMLELKLFQNIVKVS